MLQKEDGLIAFVRAMDPYNEGMMTDVLRVIAAVCLVADGYVLYTVYYREKIVMFQKNFRFIHTIFHICNNSCLLSQLRT